MIPFLVKKARADFCLTTFTEHFRKLNEAVGKNKADIIENSDSGVGDTNEYLNEFFDVEYIRKVISRLKNNKATGIDFIHNEFLKHSSDSFIEFYCSFFNVILETGVVPEIWCEGIIMPLYKNKGSKGDPDNYRGITLLSCLGKLFTACISDRVADYIHNNRMGVEQAGFRKDFSTLDHIFTLHAIINYYRNKRGRVYCAFIDYSKAFDLIDRSSLWYKLLNNNINGRVLNVIKSIYSKAKSCVRKGNHLSEFFSCGQGVRQGENLSPILFAIYLNDFSDYIAEASKGLFDLDSAINNDSDLNVFVRLYTLLYADDTIIMAETEGDLQIALNRLGEYCEEWGLKINSSKSKIVIFSRGNVTKHREFMLNGSVIDVVPDYTYLGVVFNCNGSFKKATAKQISQAKKAMFVLLQKSRILRLPIDIICQLYEVCVIPVLLYGSEIWGYEDLRDLEIFHRRFLRIVLKSFSFTPNCMLYGETNTVDILTRINIRMVNFWSKLASTDNPKLSVILCRFMANKYVCSSSSNPDSINFKWCDKIKSVLDNTGFSYVWELKSPTAFFLSEFKQRCKDIFIQNWRIDMFNNSQCNVYRLFKSVPAIGNYLITLDDCHKYRIVKFITRVHHLPVTYNRFSSVASDNNVLCPLCDTSEIGDETHYLFFCTFFKEYRSKFVPNVVLQSENINIMWKSLFELDVNDLNNISRFIKIILKTFTNKVNVTKKSKTNTIQTRFGRVVKPPLKLNW